MRRAAFVLAFGGLLVIAGGCTTHYTVHPDDLSLIHSARPRIASGREASGRLRLRHRDGTWRCLEARVRPLPDADGTYSGRSISSGICAASAWTRRSCS